MAENFDESAFRRQVDAAIAKARTVLDNEKKPVYPADVQHVYNDKYALAEVTTSTTAAALVNVLELLGLNPRGLRTLREWSGDRSVTLSLRATEECVFLRETKREEEGSTKYQTETSWGTKVVDKVVTTITEYWWEFRVEYELLAFAGNNPDEKLTLQGRKGRLEVSTTSKNSPRPETRVRDAITCPLGFLLSHLDGEGRVRCSIDRAAKECRTPRRNPLVREAADYFLRVGQWADAVARYFREDVFSVHVGHGLALSSIKTDSLFSPVAPLFLRSRDARDVAAESPSLLAGVAPVGDSAVLLTTRDVNHFLDEQKRSVSEKFAELARVFPDGVGVITVAEANLVLAALHARELGEHYVAAVNYLEDLLRKQLVAAIGKEVTPVDFVNYMNFHNRRIFREAYQPRPFAYAIRRPDHYPEGILSLEGQLLDGSMPDPVHTIVSREQLRRPMRFGISASARCSFTGEVYLHGYVSHQFGGESGVRLVLNARARQFSSFLVLVGRVTGPGLVDPQFGFVVQNRDEVTIPIDLDTIPTPKEFRDAIESLSPEQAQFAKLYRGMQLASTLFGVCVIQIKPQLERVLNLATGSLTKEIRLTQTLMDLFLQYQIPSDLLSFSGPADAAPGPRLEQVRRNVAEIQGVIERARKKEIDDAAKEAQMRMQEEIARAKPVAPVQHMAPPKSAMFRSASPRSSSVSSSSSSARMMESVSFSAPMAAASALPPPPPPSASPAAPPSDAAPAAPAAPEQPASSDAKPSTAFAAGDDVTVGRDYTKLPSELDAAFDRLDEDSALRPTILNVGHVWAKRSQKGLLGNTQQSSLNKDGQKLEKNTCFDLLDALTKSGCLGIEDAQLHIVVASTHCFEKSLMNTLVQDNVNPIEKLERSNLIVASAVHARPPQDLLVAGEVSRVKEVSPVLFLEQPQQQLNIQPQQVLAKK